MASMLEWAEAYRAQARADLEGARAARDTEPSVFAMLLQMVFEKLGKAALLRTGAIDLKFAQASHAAASRMVAVMWRERGRLKPLGGHQPWGDVLSAVVTLERCHPTLADRSPRLEYPWEDSKGVIQWPAAHLPIAQSLGSSNLGARVLRFAILLEERFDQIF